MKNILHTELLKELKRLKCLANSYICDIKLAKRSISNTYYREYPDYYLNMAVTDLRVSREFLRKVENDIKFVKKKIKEINKVTIELEEE